MSSYLVLARKYRPKQFSDMVGQQSVVRTLVNAIQMNRTHQAYVFSGSRGIGKTSIARIFSKALRCQNVQLRDGLLYSCDRCSDCHEIAAGNSVDVLEIDGASNNGVDSVREIRENAKFLPASGKYKIYIVDEVHMLSTAAFNALLKTLEEPPEHVVFIFATTEPRKIPDTILGRCQRFDFKRVTVAQITGRLREVLTAEKIEAEDAALAILARAAEGSMRDALSLLDQVISFSGERITASAVRESIGLIGTAIGIELLRGILSRDVTGALAIAQDAFNQGVDLRVLLKSLLEMQHAIVLMQAGIEKPETHFTDDEIAGLRELMPHRALEENEMIFQAFHHGLDLVGRAPQPKLVFDVLVIKTALAEALVQVGRQGAPASERQGMAQTPSSNLRRDPRPGSPMTESQRAEIAEMFSKVSATAAPAHSEAPKHPDPVKPQNGASSSSSATVSATVSTSKSDSALSGLDFSFRSPSPVAAAAAPVKPAPRTPMGPVSSEGLIDFCFKTRPVLALLLESVVEWELPQSPEGKFRIGFRAKDQSKAEQVQHKAIREQFALLAEAYFGFKIVPEAFVSSHSGESMAEKKARLDRESRESRLRAIRSHEIVQEARSLFGVDLTEIRLAGLEA